MTSKDDAKYSKLSSISYHYPLIQLPSMHTNMSSISMVFAYNGIHDDRLLALLEQEKNEKQKDKHSKKKTLPMSKVQSMPIASSRRNRPRSLDLLNIKKNAKYQLKKNKNKTASTKRTNSANSAKDRDKIPTTKAIKAKSADNNTMALTQSHSLPQNGIFNDEDNVFCDDVDSPKGPKYKNSNNKKKKKENSPSVESHKEAVIRKYKKKVSDKKTKDKLTRSSTFNKKKSNNTKYNGIKSRVTAGSISHSQSMDRDGKYTHNKSQRRRSSKKKTPTRVFYSSASEQSDDEIHVPPLQDIETSDDENDNDEDQDGFPEVDYAQLSQNNSGSSRNNTFHEHQPYPMNTYPMKLQDVPSNNSTTMTYTEPIGPYNSTNNGSSASNVGKLFHKKAGSKTESYFSDDGVQYGLNDTPPTAGTNIKAGNTSQLFTQMDNFEFTMDIHDLHSSPSLDSPKMSPQGGYRTDDTMTPPVTSHSIANDTDDAQSPQITSYNSEVKEFKLSFDNEEKQIISNDTKMMKGVYGDTNCVGIGEWTLLSTPKVFDYYNNNDNINKPLAVGNGLGLGLGLGIGGFIDRTRGVCGVSLAPIYYRYGGTLSNDRYYDKLDAYNLYTGDYITCCNKLPFNNLHDTQCSIVREGYKSTLVITGGQYYGRQIYEDSLIQRDTYFYAPWINSNYHHQITENNGFLNNNNIDKHGIIAPMNINNDTNKKERRNSDTFDMDTPPSVSITSGANKYQHKKRVSRQFVHNGATTINFNNPQTRQSSRSVSHSYRTRTDKANSIYNNNNSPTPGINDTPPLNALSSQSMSMSQTPETMNTIVMTDATSNSSTLHMPQKKKTKKKKKSSKKERVIINNTLDPDIKSKILFDGWISGPSMITPRASHGSISWDEHIIFNFGGIGISGRRIDNVEMLRMDKFKQISDLNNLRWRKCQSMTSCKSNLILIHWKPKTCIVSAGSGSKVIESYDPYKDKWKDLPPISTPQISNKSCRFYYDNHNTNCLMFIKFRNGNIKYIEYLDERMKQKKWVEVSDQYVQLFNSQYHNSSSNYLKDIKSFCL